jgi:hypothetical protein
MRGKESVSINTTNRSSLDFCLCSTQSLLSSNSWSKDQNAYEQ